jgi:adenylate cyclase, class 2
MEIEVKAYVRDDAMVRTALEHLGCTFSEPVTQDDTVYTKDVGSFEIYLANDAFFRVRIENDGRVLLTAKQPKAKTGGASLIKKEHEVTVSSAEEAREILRMIGLCEALRFTKSRITTHYGAFEICLDTVEGLGSFIEMEHVSEGDGEAIQEAMSVFLESIGVPRKDHVAKGYDILLLEKK